MLPSIKSDSSDDDMTLEEISERNAMKIVARKKKKKKKKKKKRPLEPVADRDVSVTPPPAARLKSEESPQGKDPLGVLEESDRDVSVAPLVAARLKSEARYDPFDLLFSMRPAISSAYNAASNGLPMSDSVSYSAPAGEISDERNRASLSGNTMEVIELLDNDSENEKENEGRNSGVKCVARTWVSLSPPARVPRNAPGTASTSTLGSSPSLASPDGRCAAVEEHARRAVSCSLVMVPFLTPLIRHRAQVAHVAVSQGIGLGTFKVEVKSTLRFGEYSLTIRLLVFKSGDMKKIGSSAAGRNKLVCNAFHALVPDDRTLPTVGIVRGCAKHESKAEYEVDLLEKSRSFLNKMSSTYSDVGVKPPSDSALELLSNDTARRIVEAYLCSDTKCSTQLSGVLIKLSGSFNSIFECGEGEDGKNKCATFLVGHGATCSNDGKKISSSEGKFPLVDTEASSHGRWSNLFVLLCYYQNYSLLVIVQGTKS